MKISIDMNQFNALRAKMKRAAKDSIDTKTLNKIGKESADMMRIRTSQGYGVRRSEGEKFKLAPLKESTVESRKRAKKKGVLPKGVGARKSRLTFTGKMLEAIKHKVMGRDLSFFIDDSQREEVAAYHDTGNSNMPARPFFHFSNKEVKKISQMFREAIKKVLRNKF